MSDELVVDVFKKMTEADYLSVPVYDKASEKYVGLVDTGDLLAWVVNVYCHETTGTRDREPLKAMMKQHAKSSLFLGEKIGKISDVSHRNPFVPIDYHATLADAVEKLAKGVHRLPVMQDGKVVGIISQSGVIKYLSAHPDLIPDEVAVLPALPMSRTKQLVHANMEDHVIDVCVKMVETGVSAVPVLGQNHMMIANFSASDVRKLLYVSPSRLSMVLESPLRSFLHEFQASDAGADTRSPTMGINKDDTVSSSISKIKGLKIHRLWVISPQHHVQGVLTLTDILAFLITQ